MTKSTKKFWKLQNSVDRSGSTLYLEGPISQESWWGDEVTPQEFRNELKQIVGNLTVVINSTGGDVWAAVSIYDALKELENQVTVRVSGLAASAASIIAMAGDSIEMTPGSTMMVHRASTFAWGNGDELEKVIEMLETVEEGIVSIYADRTGLSTQEIQDLLSAETWMSAEKAVEMGFADKVVKPAPEEADDPSLQNVFSGNFAFSMSATKKSLDSFLEKAKIQNKVSSAVDNEDEEEPEAPAPGEPEVPPATPPEEGDPNGNPDTETPDAPSDDEESKTDDEEEAGPSAPENNKPANKSDKEGKVDMKTAQDSVATEGIEPKNKPEQAAQPQQAAYLSTKKSVEDFAQILVENAGKTPAEVKEAWGEHLVEMGVTNPEILLPDALITEIEDAFSKGGEIWNLLNKTGLTVFRAAWDTVTGEDSRAKGYNRADEENKAEEQITIADRVLRPQFVYKYITLNKEDIKENRDTGALVRYVLSELPKRIVREIERAVVIGDGRANDSDYKIDSFTAVKADAAANNVFAKRYVPEAGDARYKSLLKARDLVKADGSKYLVAKTGYLTDLLLEQGVNGGYIFAPGTDVARALGFAGSFEPDWLDDTNDADNDAYIVVFDAYKTVGDNTIEAFTNFVLKTNKQEYLQEIYAGGGLTKRDSAVAIATTPEAS